MTTKPKAKKFRVRKPAAEADTGAQSQAAAQSEAPAAADSDQQATRPKRPVRVVPDAAASGEAPKAAFSTEIADIEREGLSGRQLRMARRVAQKNGLDPTSDFDAVRQLRLKGIDPFQRTNLREIAGGKESGAEQLARIDPATVQLPQTVPQPNDGANVDTRPNPSARREREISEIQRDIVRRRRKKMALLFSRLTFFVTLPTLIAGWYFYVIATPMFATNSEFLIIQSEGSGGGGGLGSLLPTQFSTSQDAIAVQAYLQSKDAMLQLDEDAGFRSHFQQSWIDRLQRLDEGSSSEAAHSTYKDRVKIGFDPTEGVIRMEVSAATPDASLRFSEELISYAEERVNELSSRKREDQVSQANSAVEQARADRRDAQEDLVQLQTRSGTLDPEGVIGGLRGQITQLESLITEKKIELATLLNNDRPNRAKVDGARAAIEIFEEELTALNARMTDISQGENSLAEVTIRIQLAQADLATADLLLQSAIQQREQAEAEARRQVRYLTVAVRPVAPEEPSYPRAFENTILAFLIFAGIYLMISLTASILREQVTS